MIDDIDDDDVLLFDEVDEEDVDEEARMRRTLVVGATVADPADLNVMEGQYRREGFFPTMFIEDGPDGNPVLENVADFAKLMKLPAGTPVTLEQALAFEARNTSPDGRWTGG